VVSAWDWTVTNDLYVLLARLVPAPMSSLSRPIEYTDACVGNEQEAQLPSKELN